MPLLIDAYNVLHVIGVLPPAMAGLDESGLAALVAAHGMRGEREAVLVCDGGPDGPAESRRSAAAGVEIRYAGAGSDADTLLERLIDADSAPRRLIVVSSDRRVQRAARRRGAKALASDEYLRSVVARSRRAGPTPAPHTNALRAQVPLDVYSTAGWMRAFGYDPSEIIARAGSARAVIKPTPPTRRAPDPPRDTRPPQNGTPSALAEPANEPPLPAPAKSPPTDPLLLEAMQAWEGRLSLDDLDMERWLGGIIERPRD